MVNFIICQLYLSFLNNGYFGRGSNSFDKTLGRDFWDDIKFFILIWVAVTWYIDMCKSVYLYACDLYILNVYVHVCVYLSMIKYYWKIVTITILLQPLKILALGKFAQK